MKDEARKFLEKAERALHAAKILIDAGETEFAAGRIYYAMLHAAQAILREKDLEFRKHSGVHAAFGEHFIKTGLIETKYHRWLLDAFDERLQGDYDFQVHISQETITDLYNKAADFVKTIRQNLQ